MSTEHVPEVSPELPSRWWRATLALLGRLPQAALSRSLGRVADVPLPAPLRRPVIGGFARAVGVDTDEIERPLTTYRSLNDFFVRRLREGVRSWPGDARSIAAPVDGIVGRYGVISKGRLIQAKGRDYSAAALLADNDAAARFDGGTFITIYLSPRHYHRIHAPCTGSIIHARYVPGALLPVNEPAVQHVPDLFPRNERVICTIDAALGHCAVVAVGAYNVGRISTAFDADWAGAGGSVANRGAAAELRHYRPPIPIRQGDEIMAFHLGSTIVMLLERGHRTTMPDTGTEIAMGTLLASA